MSILDRYLFQLFLRSYLMFFFSMLGLYMVIDLFTNVDELGEDAQSIGHLVSRIARYYSWHALDYFARMSPVMTQMAAMYTLADFRRHNEMTPILAAGIPARRAVTPILIGVLLVVALGAANREFALPAYSEHLQRPHDDVDGARLMVVGSRIDSDGMLLRADRAFREGRRLEDVKLTLPDLQEVTAERAAFGVHDGKDGLLLEEFAPADVRETEKIRRPPDGRLFVATSVTFGELVRSSQWTRFASATELVEELGKPQPANPHEIRALVHNRIMQPAASLVLVLLGIPFVISSDRRKFFVNLAVAMVLSAGYFVLDATSIYLAGFGYFDPTFAAWLPIFIFLPVATSLWRRVAT